MSKKTFKSQSDEWDRYLSFCSLLNLKPNTGHSLQRFKNKKPYHYGTYSNQQKDTGTNQQRDD